MTGTCGERKLVEQFEKIVCLVVQEEGRVDLDDQLAVCHGRRFYPSVQSGQTASFWGHLNRDLRK